MSDQFDPLDELVTDPLGEETPVPSYRNLHPLSRMVESHDFPAELREPRYNEDEQYAYYIKRISDDTNDFKRIGSVRSL